MQAWSRVGDDFLLLDQWREQADVDTAVSALKFAVRGSSPALVRIEFSGYGQILARDLQKTSRSVEIQLVPTDHRSKSARLLRHVDLIQSGRIKLAQGADWREAWVSEFETFPKGPFDDQVDACTLALDFFVQGLPLTKPQPRALGGVLNHRGGWIDARRLTQRGAYPHVVTRQRFGIGVFPKKRS